MRRATTATSTCAGGAKWICTGFTAVSTSCPAMEVSFQGIKQKDYNALTGVTAKWSDGYFINYKAFVTAAAFTNGSANAANVYENFGTWGGYQIAFGNALTKTAGAMGGYMLSADYGLTDSNTNCAVTGSGTCLMRFNSYLKGKYMAAAAITTAKPVDAAETYVDITVAGAGGGNWQFKTAAAGAAGTALADMDAKWYFPKYVKPAKVDAEDSATGDRLNKGDLLSIFASGLTATRGGTAIAAANACGTGVAVANGAATLAAGSLALAAALAM